MLRQKIPYLISDHVPSKPNLKIECHLQITKTKYGKSLNIGSSYSLSSRVKNPIALHVVAQNFFCRFKMCTKWRLSAQVGEFINYNHDVTFKLMLVLFSCRWVLRKGAIKMIGNKTSCHFLMILSFAAAAAASVWTCFNISVHHWHKRNRITMARRFSITRERSKCLVNSILLYQLAVIRDGIIVFYLNFHAHSLNKWLIIH